jgi:Mycothiol maleylpyruvate isomerase N-terminal domain
MACVVPPARAALGTPPRRAETDTASGPIWRAAIREDVAMMTVRAAYLSAAGAAVALISDPVVAERWAEPSALAEFRVSGLAGHLARQILTAPVVLAQVGPTGDLVTLLDHYARVRWLATGLDDEANARIRADGADAAADGPAVLIARTTAALNELRRLLPAEPAGRTVHLPWGPWSLTLDDFLTTRLMEIVVHSDDLAVSTGLATPALPAEAVDPVIVLLARLAVRRHGPTPVLRALSRAERAPATVAAF